MSTEAHACEPEAGTVVLEITGLTNGPDGIARHEGRVVFVSGVAPGDVVRARIVEEHPSFARARVVHHCARGGAHRVPRCAWVEACGGCPWQQVVYPTQLAAKAASVHETLARIGGVVGARELPIHAAPDEWRYRHRVRLHVGGRGTLGYRRPRSHQVVEIGDCVIADATITATLPIVRELVRRLATRVRSVELLANGDGRVVVSAVATGPFAAADDARLTALLAEHVSIAGVQLATAEWQRARGDLRLVVRPDQAGTTIVQRPGTFSQVNPAANRLLVETVLAMATPARRVLDLFCGTGNLSLPLAHAGAEVTGVDANPAAIADARTSAAAAGLTATRFEDVPALRFLGRQGLAGAELVVLDPPRTGAAAEVAQLARLRPRRILYVSCDPATLARDVAVLAANRYIVDRVQALDLFPQTPHVETVLEAVGAID
jgi:23S rRNA (uracil1939-C5)-methyltransferase